jgi:hypothetical protein
MFTRKKRIGKSVSFAEPTWDQDSPPWQELDRELPANHLARLVVERMVVFDLAPLLASYQGRGSKPYRPVLCDLDSPFLLGYQVFAQTSDANTLGPMLERTADLLGKKLVSQCSGALSGVPAAPAMHRQSQSGTKSAPQ